MDRESAYSREQIEEICEEVERQWEYRFIARAAFPTNILKVIPEYESSPYHIQHGAQMKVRVPVPLPPLKGMCLLSLTAACQVYAVSLKAGQSTYKGFAADCL
jgi:hypothetical protein